MIVSVVEKLVGIVGNEDLSFLRICPTYANFRFSDNSNNNNNNNSTNEDIITNTTNNNNDTVEAFDIDPFSDEDVPDYHLDGEDAGMVCVPLFDTK